MARVRYMEYFFSGDPRLELLLDPLLNSLLEPLLDPLYKGAEYRGYSRTLYRPLHVVTHGNE